MRNITLALLLVALTTQATIAQTIVNNPVLNRYGRHPAPVTKMASYPTAWKAQVTTRPQLNTYRYQATPLNQVPRPIANVRDYTIKRYFTGNPNLSPYLHLTRPAKTTSLNNYHRYVLPQQDGLNATAPQSYQATPWNR